MHSIRTRYPSSSSMSMTWNTAAHLTPSPEPSDDPVSDGKLIHYATPPSSPTILQRAGEVSFARTIPVVMESVRPRYFSNNPYQRSRDQCEFGADQRYDGLAEMSQQRSLIPSSRATDLFSQVTYPLEQGYGLQHTAAPHMQNNSTPYDTGYSQINQRQYRYPAFSSSLMYNTVVEAPVIQPGAQHLSDFDTVQQYSSSHPPSPTALDIPTQQFEVPQHYYNATGQSPSTLMNVLPAYSIVQHQPLDQPSHQRTRASTVHQSVPPGLTLYQPLTSLHDMSSQQSASTLAENLYGDVSYETFADLSRKAYRYIQEGRLLTAGNSVLELSAWLMKVLTRFGLTQDDVSRHASRLQLWKDFNHCWLALLQKQKDLSSEARTLTHQPTSLPDLLQIDFLKQMGDELVRICDHVEGHGLVDYEMGFWEEEIMTGKKPLQRVLSEGKVIDEKLVLLECIDILEGTDSKSPSKLHNDFLSKIRQHK